MAGLKFNVRTQGIDEIGLKIASAASKSSHIVALQVAKDTSRYVPMRTGSLNNRTRVVGDMIIYPGPYARYLYYGKLMVDPGTGSAWAKKGDTKVLTNKNLVIHQTVHPQAQSHWFEASKAQNLDKWIRVARKSVGNEI